MNRISNIFAVIGLVCIIFVAVPLIIGIVVSGGCLPWMNDQSQWISFWGNYLGALIGGVLSGAVAIYVMRQTIKHENDERSRKEKIEFCLKLNEYIMEYGSKIGNYCLIVYDIDKVEKRKEYNELIRLSGIINSLLNSKLKDKKYNGVEEFTDISQRLIKKIGELDKNPNTDIGVIIDFVNELRNYSADFMNMNQ